MKTTARAIAVALAAGACFAPGVASAFVSGSTGADGALTPTVNTTVTLPPSGIFNFTSVTIPSGVTVKFLRNTTNTPVVILATGDVTIGGTLDVSGGSSPGVGSGGDGVTGDDGAPGLAGSGGFDGGRGGPAGANSVGGTGLGPGGALGGTVFAGNNNCGFAVPLGGGGAGYFAAGATANPNPFYCPGTAGGTPYGTNQILPLIGGSGGGGGAGGATFAGSGGGGGGGALLIASSGTVNVTGTVNANGGSGGASGGSGAGAPGGGGSGGAIRILATTIAGGGTISAVGGSSSFLGTGSVGRIRFEAESFTRPTSAVTSPTASAPAAGTAPGPVFVAGTPTLTISSVAGISAPASPTGNADITLASSTANPVTVVFTTTGVPVGNTVQLTLTPAFGSRSSVISPALTGSTASATASVQITLPVGPSVLSAQTTFTIVAALGDLLRNFAGNERVEKVTLVATLGGLSKVKLITVSGKEYDAPAEALRIAALGG